MAGLLDTYEQTANAQAWSVLLKMAAYFKRRIESVIATKGMAWWEGCLLQEYGGMNEVGYNLYAITGDEEHRQLGDYFCARRLLSACPSSAQSSPAADGCAQTRRCSWTQSRSRKSTP